MIQDGYCICFNKWVLDTRIKNELPILLIISSLTAKTGECFAGNKYFAELFNCTEVSISQKINKLIELGYISAEYEKRGAEIKKRILRLKNFLTDDLNIFYPTIKKDFKDNNINIKNINNNIYMQDFEKFWKEYPKQRAGSKDKAYKSFCKAINEKRTTVDLLLESVKRYALSDEVIKGYAKGCAAWLNDDRFNNRYNVNKQEEKILIDENMRIDEDMIEFKDMTWEECSRASEWLLKNKYCQEITKEQFVELVRKFKNDRR